MSKTKTDKLVAANQRAYLKTELCDWECETCPSCTGDLADCTALLFAENIYRLKILTGQIQKLTRLNTERRDKINVLSRRVAELEHNLAVAKADMKLSDNDCQMCVGPLDGCEYECKSCNLAGDCLCRDCRGNSHWQWKGDRN